MFKRVMLFAATNIAVLLVLSIVLRLLGVDRMVLADGNIDYRALMIFAVVWGMAGSLISLALSKTMAVRSTGARVIDTPANPTETWLVETVGRQARKAGIGMPDVAVYDSPDVNAFATGARRNSALVAVSTGLLSAMDRREAEAVLAHEISHVANGDMVTLTLIQGVLNAFVIFFSRIIGHTVDAAMRGGSNRGGPGIGYFAISMLMQVVLGVLATMIVRWFSRYREFRADAGAANLESRDGMIAALERLRRGRETAQLPQQIAALGISGSVKSGFRQLFATHPPIEQRISALQQLR